MSGDDVGESPPPAVGPSPQQIGSAFIKQYYKILLTAPAQLNRFYQPDSTITRGMEPSAPATPVPFSTAATEVGVNGSSSGGDESMGERVRKAFFDWASVINTNGEGESAEVESLDALTVDFERGAIDAQESIGGGILLVVTGHMSLPGKVGKTSAFVHTFFLNNAAVPGRKKQFLVKNDILRFLDPVDDAKLDEKVVEEEVATLLPEVEEAVLTISPAAAIDPIPIVPVEYEPSVDEEKVEDVEPLKEPANESPTEVTESYTVESDSTPTASSTSDGKRSKRNRGKKGRLGASKSRSRSSSPGAVDEEKDDEEEEEEPASEKPKVPSSWANLVASGGGGGKGNKGGRKGSPKPSPTGTADKSTSSVKPDLSSSKAPPQSRSTNGFTAVANTNSSSSTSEINYQSKPSERTAEATLFIRNIPDKTKEPEIRALFEKQAAANGNKILGITLNPNRGFCFVDFDGPDAVVSIVAESITSLVKDQRTGRKVESSFMAHGRVLEVERKVASKGFGGGGGGKAMDSGGGGGRKFNRSKSPKEGGENGEKFRDRRGGGVNDRRDRDKIGGGGGGKR